MSVIDENELQRTHSQLKQCRICFDSDNSDDIISPCLCSGGSAYIHRRCLDLWRSENIGGRGFKFCNVCQFEYVIETVINDSEADKERLLKYRLLVTRDLTLIFLLSQLIIIGSAFLIKMIDRNGNNIKDLFSNSFNEFFIYYITAIILLLAILGFITLIIVCYSNGNNGSNCFNPTCGRTSGGSFIVMILMCAVVGIFVGIFLSIIILKKIMQHHTDKLWLRQETQKYIVKDFQERRNELEKYKKGYHNSSTTLTMNTYTDIL
jgi:E3 ubiquitin-protein ligase DOA10